MGSRGGVHHARGGVLSSARSTRHCTYPIGGSADAPTSPYYTEHSAPSTYFYILYYYTVSRAGFSSSTAQSHASLIEHLFDNIVCEAGLDFSVAQLAGGGPGRCVSNC